MSKSNVSSKSNAGAKSASKSKGASKSNGASKGAPTITSAMRILSRGRNVCATGACANSLSRTARIEHLLITSSLAGRALRVREIEDTLGAEVKCVRNHINTLYSVKNLLARDESGAYSVRPEVLKTLNGASKLSKSKGAK